MDKEVRQGLGLLAVASVFGLLLLITGTETGTIGSVVRVAAILFGLVGLAFVAVGLLRSAR